MFTDRANPLWVATCQVHTWEGRMKELGAAFFEGADSLSLGVKVATALGRERSEGWGSPTDDDRYDWAVAGLDDAGRPQVLFISGMYVELVSLAGTTLMAAPYRDIKRFIARGRRTLDIWTTKPPGSGFAPAKHVHHTLDDSAQYVEKRWCHSPSRPHLGGQLPPVDFRLEPYLYYLGRLVDASAKVELMVSDLLQTLESSADSPKRYLGESGDVLWNRLDVLADNNSGFRALAERCRSAWRVRNLFVHGSFIPSANGRPSRVVRKYLRDKAHRKTGHEYEDGPADLGLPHE